MNIWGIPPAGTSDATAFWASFWPALWSGAIYSVICGVISGVIVGIVVLRYQRGWEARAARRTYERDLSLLLDDLRNALYEPEVVKIDSAHESMPVAAGAALARLKSEPLSLWRDHLSSNAVLIGAALDLQRRAAEFLGTAHELDNTLQQLARSYNHSRNAVAHHDAPIRQYAIGRLLGFTGEQLLPWLRETGLNKVTPFEEVWQGWLSANASMQALGSRFVQRRETVMNQVQALQRAIDA